MKKLEVQTHLRHGKVERSTKEQIQKKLKPKVGVTKIGCSNFVNRMFWYFLNRSNLIRDRDLICFGKIFLFCVKDMHPIVYKHIGHDRLMATQIEYTQFY
jgi:hypothetical protein